FLLLSTTTPTSELYTLSLHDALPIFHLVLGAHHRAAVALPDRRLVPGKVDLVQRPLVDQLVDGGAIGLLVVRGVVLDRRDGALRLDAAHVGGGDPAGEERVFAVRLEGAAVDRYPGQVDVRPLKQ